MNTYDVDFGNIKNFEKLLKSKSMKRLKLKIKIKLLFNYIFSKDIFMKPLLIDDKYKLFNIVGYKNKFFALRKDAGPIDIVDLYKNPSKYPNKFLESRSLFHLKKLINWENLRITFD